MLKPARRVDEGTLVVEDEETHSEADTPTSEMDLSMDTWFVQMKMNEEDNNNGKESEVGQHDGYDGGDGYDAPEKDVADRQRHTEDAVGGSLSIHDKDGAEITSLKKNDDSPEKKKAKEGLNK